MAVECFPLTSSVFSEKYDRFRRLLITARKEAGLTQAVVAEKLARPQSYVSKYERGERRLDVIEFFDVAQALGIEPFRFLHALQDHMVHASPERSPR
jgi:transcriptional regulator with XRE-family HTH domain